MIHEPSPVPTKNRDEFDRLLSSYVVSPAKEPSVAERWERLSDRIMAFDHLQTTIEHVTTQGTLLTQAILFLRPWHQSMVPRG